MTRRQTLWAAAAACAVLAACATTPAYADNYVAQDGSKNLITLAAKLFSGALHPFHIMEGLISGSGNPQPVSVDGSGNVNVNVVSGGTGGGAVTQSGTWNVGLTGNLPAYAATPTFNFGTLNGAATAANQASANTSLATIATAATGPIPAQSGHGVNIGGVEGVTASGATLSENPVADGCRAATTIPAPVTDGQKVARECSVEGKAVVDIGAAGALRRRGAANTASTSAQAFTNWAAPATGNNFYITDVTCHREDTGTTTIHASLNDSAGTYVPMAASSGSTLHFITPLKSASTATAPTFTLSAALTGGNAYCSAEGYEGG